MKVRINDLAKELELKSRSILEALAAVGVTEPKNLSSSIEEDQAYLVRAYFSRGDRAAEFTKSAKEMMAVRFASSFKPGDALQAILDRKRLEKLEKEKDKHSKQIDSLLPVPDTIAAPDPLRAAIAPVASDPTPTMAPVQLKSSASQQVTAIIQPESYGAPEIAELRRELIRYFSLLEFKAGVKDSLKRKGFSDRIHALKNSALVPRTVAAIMSAFAEFRNDLEYSPEGKLSATEARLLKEMDFFLRSFLNDRFELANETK